MLLDFGGPIWEFPKIRGTLFGGPYNKDPTIWGTISGSPIFGNSHMLAQSGTIATHLVSVWPQSVARLA